MPPHPTYEKLYSKTHPDPRTDRQDDPMDVERTIKAQMNLARLQRVYYLLTVKRVLSLVAPLAIWYLAAFASGVSEFSLESLMFVFLCILEMFFVFNIIVLLFRQRRSGWLGLLLFTVGIPVGIAFIQVESQLLRIALTSLPFLTFYLYSLSLRWAIGNWMSDTSVDGRQAVEMEDKRVFIGKRLQQRGLPGWFDGQIGDKDSASQPEQEDPEHANGT
jgi:hypothetical protein